MKEIREEINEDVIEETTIFDLSSFGDHFYMGKKLMETAERNNVSAIEMIGNFIEDLQNIDNEDYQTKVEDINIKGKASSKSLGKLIDYLNKLKKRLIQTENDAKRKEKKKIRFQEMEIIWEQIEEKLQQVQGKETEAIERLLLDIKNGNSSYEFDNKTKKFVLKKLNERKTAKENAESSINQAMEDIEEIVERELANGSITDKAKGLESIKNAIIGGKSGVKLNIKLQAESKQQLLQMLDNKIEIAKMKDILNK